MTRATRREFLAASAAATLALGAARPAHARTKELKADIAIIGGSLGGVAAALAALRAGATVILTEETTWIGGQVTSQAVPPDENPWIETFGGTKSYQAYRTGVRDYYRKNYPLTDAAKAVEFLNPGNGNVSKLCHEPRVSVALLEALLAPFEASGKLQRHLRTVPIAVDVAHDRVRAVTVRSLDSGHDTTLHAKYFLDATELGDLLPLAKAAFVTGAEARADTQEPHAPETARPDNVQAITWCFAMEHLAGENHVGDKPATYDMWKAYIPPLTPPWFGPLFSLSATHPQTLKERALTCDPEGDGKSDWFRYRRIVDRRNFTDGFSRGDVSLVNWPQNDYLPGGIYGGTPEDAAKHREGARQLSLSWLYWLQTECPRPDGGTGWPGLRLRPELMGTKDGLAMYPYIRESRRIKARFTVTENHVGKAARLEKLGGKPDTIEAEQFPDSVGIGYYRIDLHPSTGGDNYIDIDSLPFQIPLGALIPVRLENLLPACKSLGTTHISNGCYRLHPVEWNIGEAAGALAAHCLRTGETPHQIHEDTARIADFQRELEATGVRTHWPDEARIRKV